MPWRQLPQLIQLAAEVNGLTQMLLELPNYATYMDAQSFSRGLSHSATAFSCILAELENSAVKDMARMLSSRGWEVNALTAAGLVISDPALSAAAASKSLTQLLANEGHASPPSEALVTSLVRFEVVPWRLDVLFEMGFNSFDVFSFLLHHEMPSPVARSVAVPAGLPAVPQAGGCLWFSAIYLWPMTGHDWWPTDLGASTAGTWNDTARAHAKPFRLKHCPISVLPNKPPPVGNRYLPLEPAPNDPGRLSRSLERKAWRVLFRHYPR